MVPGNDYLALKEYNKNMENYVIVQFQPEKLNSAYIYVILGVLVAQWLIVPYGVAFYRHLLNRRYKAR